MTASIRLQICGVLFQSTPSIICHSILGLQDFLLHWDIIHEDVCLLSDVISGRVTSDYKSMFQEVLQADGPVAIRYETIREEGPDHDKTFYVKVFVNDKEKGSGSGKSKKEAEQNAAKDALEPIEEK